MNNPSVIIIVCLAVMAAIIGFCYLHKRHKEYHMNDIVKAIQSAYVGGKTSVEKQVLVNAVKKYFHCSSKEALYIIGVARRKKLVDIEAGNIKILKD